MRVFVISICLVVVTIRMWKYAAACWVADPRHRQQHHVQRSCACAPVTRRASRCCRPWHCDKRTNSWHPLGAGAHWKPLSTVPTECAHLAWGLSAAAVVSVWGPARDPYPHSVPLRALFAADPGQVALFPASTSATWRNARPAVALWPRMTSLSRQLGSDPALVAPPSP